MRVSMLSLAAFILVTGTPGAEAQTVSPDPAAVEPGTYKVEPAHTQIGFSISHLGFTNFAGSFAGASGTLQLDPAAPQRSHLAVVVTVGSITTTVPELSERLKGDQWFDTAHYPEASFTSTKIVRTGPRTAVIDGALILHGVSKPITLEAQLLGSGVNPLDKAFTAGFEATGTIKRSEFGMTTYLPLLGDEVRLTIAGAFERQP